MFPAPKGRANIGRALRALVGLFAECLVMQHRWWFLSSVVLSRPTEGIKLQVVFDFRNLWESWEEWETLTRLFVLGTMEEMQRMKWVCREWGNMTYGEGWKVCG